MTIRWVLSDFLQELSPALAEHLLETHFPGCKPILGPQLQLTPSTKDWLNASSVITEEKIRWAINRLLDWLLDCYQIKHVLLAASKRSQHFILYACAQLWQT
jgi:hypothetical protein